MTLTLEIAPETLRALEEKAQRAGVPLTAYAVGVLEHDAIDANGTSYGADATTDTTDAEAARLAAIDAVAGKYARLRERGFNSDAVRAERDRERQREDRFNERFEKRQEEKRAA